MFYYNILSNGDNGLYGGCIAAVNNVFVGKQVSGRDGNCSNFVEG
jgi:hypothetical protein